MRCATADDGVPSVAARSFEAIFDETWQNDLAPFRGYRMPLTVIAPQIETHSLLGQGTRFVMRVPVGLTPARATGERHLPAAGVVKRARGRAKPRERHVA